MRTDNMLAADIFCGFTLDPDDLADFIACYFSQSISQISCDQADYDGSGTADPDDLADYIAAYFAGC